LAIAQNYEAIQLKDAALSGLPQLQDLKGGNLKTDQAMKRLFEMPHFLSIFTILNGDRETAVGCFHTPILGAQIF
jgi:hypothetical protein